MPLLTSSKSLSNLHQVWPYRLSDHLGTYFYLFFQHICMGDAPYVAVAAMVTLS